jgi:lipopolysaccharide/colanic/teichoic acid biosynthesis glycosyltransferase
MRSEHAVAIPRSNLQVGVARSLNAPRQATFAPATSPALSYRLRFFTGETLGLLFVMLSTVYIFALPTTWLRRDQAMGVVGRAVKRLIDIVGSIIGLIITLPLFLIVPLLIKLDSPGPVFYLQTRIGADNRRRDRRTCQRAGAVDRRARDRRRANYYGRPFNVIKFRTMVQDAESKSGPVWASKNDPRVTKLGALLRKTRIDEIPQFLCVLKGDMSLVGPRPERPKFVEDLSQRVDGYTDRLAVKPGITGLAQVVNGYDDSLASVARKVRLDLEYINTWSIWSDIKILLRTVLVVFTGKGAH